MRKSITLHEVATLAGVSTATVTRVLRGDVRVAGETRERVQGMLNSTGYQVNTIAQSLRTKRVATVAHILNSFFPNPFYTNVASGLQREATKYGYEVLTYDAENSPKVEREAVQAALRRRSDSIIFTTPIKAENVALATSAGVRVVQVERPTEAPSAVVTVDNYYGAWEATDYLISLGHRDITFIGRRFSKRPGHGGLGQSHASRRLSRCHAKGPGPLRGCAGGVLISRTAGVPGAGSRLCRENIGWPEGPNGNFRGLRHFGSWCVAGPLCRTDPRSR